MIKKYAMKIPLLRSALTSVAAKLFVTQVVVALSALIANVFSARILGPEARGELALFMQVAYVANAVSVLGRHRAYLRLDSDGPVSLATSYKDIRVLSRTPLVISVVIAMIAALITGSGAIASLVLAIGFFALIYSGVQQKTYRAAAIVSRDATPYFIGTLVGQFMLLVSVVILAVYEITDISIWLAVYGISVIVPYLIVSLSITLRGKEPQSNELQIVQVKRLGMNLMPLSAAEILGSRLDRFLIPVLANFTQLGVYTVVVTMTEIVAWPVKNYTDSKVPQWSREISDGRFKIFKTTMMVSTGIIGLSVFVGIILGEILVPLFGNEYTTGVKLVWPLVLAAALHAWTQFGTNLSLAAGYTALANGIPIAAMIASAISYFFFVPWLGAMGAAWGLVVGYSVGILASLLGILRIVKRTGS